MNRGLAISSALHAIAFAILTLSPVTKARSFDLATALPVELVAPLPDVPAPRETKPEPPREIPPPVNEPLVAPEPEPVPESVQSEPPEPVKTPPRKKPKPRTIKRYAPRRDEAQPTLAERLQQRLADPPSDPPPDPPTDPVVEPPPAAPEKTTEVTASDFPFAWYLNTLRTKITDAWDPPAGRMVAEDANRIVVRFRIHRDGRVSDVQVEGGSGSAGLEASVRRAVEGARPFPVLPDAYADDVLDVAVRFKVSGAAG